MSTQTEAPEAEGSKTSLIVFSIIALVVAGMAFNSWRVRSGWLRDIRSSDPAARTAAAQAMMRRGQVAEQLQGQPPSVRLAAVRALSEIRSPLDLAQAAAREIMQFRKDPDAPISDQAKVKLIDMGPEIVLKPALLDPDCALESSDDAIGGGIQDVLKAPNFTKLPDNVEDGTIPLVAKKLPHPDARNNAANILADLDTPAIPYVVPYLHPKAEEMIGTTTVEDVQLTAISILDRQADPKAIESIPDLIKMLDYQHTQRAAVGALGRMPPEHTKAAVLPLMRVLERNELIRNETVVALGRLGDPRAVPALVQYLGSFSEDLRGQASEAIRNILRTNPQAIGPALAATRSPDPLVRAAAIDAVAVSAVPAARTAGLAALKDPDARVRTEAARGLGERADPTTVPALIATLNDSNGQVGTEAARSLAAIGQPAVPALVAALKAPTGSPQSYYAQQALRDIGHPAIPALVRAARSGDDTTARYAALILGDLGTNEGIAALRDAARRPSPEVRWAAERSLQALLGSTDTAAS